MHQAPVPCPGTHTVVSCLRGRQRANLPLSIPTSRCVLGELAESVWVNPADMLLAYLRSPVADGWLARAEAAVAGLTGAQARAAALTPDAVGDQIAQVLRGSPPVGRGGVLQLLSAVDDSGCSLVAVADARRTPPVWTAITVLDDGPAAVADEVRHKRRWQAWLYWSNLLQFLETGGGDSAQLTTSLLNGFSTDELAVTGGVGWLASSRNEIFPLLAQDEHARPAEPVPVPVSRRPVPEQAPPPRDPAWERVLEYLDPDEPGLAVLARSLADAGAPVPADGFELDDRGWMAELAWPDRRIGVVLAPAPVGSSPTSRRRTATARSSRQGGRSAPPGRGTWAPSRTVSACNLRGLPHVVTSTTAPLSTGSRIDEHQGRHPAPARQGGQGDPQAPPLGQGRDLRLPAQVQGQSPRHGTQAPAAQGRDQRRQQALVRTDQ